MKNSIIATVAMLILASSCNMENNPLLTESKLPYGAPQFDKIKNEHYIPAFEKAIAEERAEIDAIVADPEAPTFANTIEALEFSGETLDRVSSIFYNLMEADTDDEMQEIAEKISPMMTEISMYVSLNEKLFERVKAVWEQRESLGLDPDQMRLLDKTYKGFVRNGANLSPEDKELYSKYSEELSLAQLQFSKNSLAATNAFSMTLTEEAELEGLPEFVKAIGAEAAKAKGVEGWVFDLTAPSFSPFMKYSARRDLREKLWTAYNTKAVGGEFDNTELCRKIAGLRIKMANLLGYKTWAEFTTEDRMVKSAENVHAFLDELMEPSLPAAKKDVAAVYEFAVANGFDESELQPWDFSYWSEKYKDAEYSLSDEQLKPYFQLENCIDAVFGLATKLYGLQFEERSDIPGYNKDVKVFDVKDAEGRHMALFYADFFPRASKGSGAWMTEFRGQSIKDSVERRPFISICANFSKPTGDDPSLLTHDELTTFLHEFGHSLHGILAEGRYPSLTCTNVDHDFVELPSQIMENWAFEREYLKPFAKHYQTGEEIPDGLIDRIIASKNYLSAYAQVRQLQYGTIDMAWHDIEALPETGTVELEKKAIEPFLVVASPAGTCSSTTFGHIFTGGYSAGYYSYKWAEVLAADAFSLFEEKGIFNTEVSHSFRDNVLSKGSSEEEAVLYRNYRGHDPQPKALLVKLGIISAEE
ncbi:MAG: M3 family metallopeptidase [Bacteroidia bacterium]|nr:M3 family metallopeptidase [Bacteroidia bacterium]